MTEFQKTQLKLTITRIETRIDSYIRIAEKASRQALYDGECGYRESAQFNKGQEFALHYVIDDFQIVLQGLKAVMDHGDDEN